MFSLQLWWDILLVYSHSTNFFHCLLVIWVLIGLLVVGGEYYTMRRWILRILWAMLVRRALLELHKRRNCLETAEELQRDMVVVDREGIESYWDHKLKVFGHAELVVEPIGLRLLRLSFEIVEDPSLLSNSWMWFWLDLLNEESRSQRLTWLE